jgi:hypothetical protein
VATTSFSYIISSMDVTFPRASDGFRAPPCLLEVLMKVVNIVWWALVRLHIIKLMKLGLSVW